MRHQRVGESGGPISDALARSRRSRADSFCARRGVPGLLRVHRTLTAE
jgi:hypothetical protein